jgi:hypothetical protein
MSSLVATSGTRDGLTQLSGSSGFSSAAIAVYSLYIINKAGGLIYQKDFYNIPKLPGNDYLRLLSTFHSFILYTSEKKCRK